MGVGEHLGEQLAQQSLMALIGVGVQQRDGYRFGAGECDVLDQRPCRRGIERLQRAVVGHALRRGEAQLVGHERRRCRAAQLIQVGSCLAPELEYVGESVGGDQSGARRPALQQRIRRHGHAVREALHLLRSRAGSLEHDAHRFKHGHGLVVGRRGDLGRMKARVGADEHRVGERAADVDAKQHDGSVWDRGRDGMRDRIGGCGRFRRPPARGPPYLPGAGGTGSSRCAAAARAGTPRPCG